MSCLGLGLEPSVCTNEGISPFRLRTHKKTQNPIKFRIYFLDAYRTSVSYNTYFRFSKGLARRGSSEYAIKRPSDKRRLLARSPPQVPLSVCTIYSLPVGPDTTDIESISAHYIVWLRDCSAPGLIIFTWLTTATTCWPPQELIGQCRTTLSSSLQATNITTEQGTSSKECKLFSKGKAFRLWHGVPYFGAFAGEACAIGDEMGFAEGLQATPKLPPTH